jgi:ATP-dependent DNA helicase DinG
MVLTTTLRAMRAIADCLRLALQGRDDLNVLVQGQHPKRALIEMFTAPRSGDSVTVGCILVASVSFWEGIDIPGDALQLLVIDKLPFAPPDDPVQVARAQRLEAAGKSAFRHLHLPHAAVALKQGAGRLIRRETDQGVLIICDVRMSTMGYGKQLVKALPPMQRLTSHQALLEKLDSLTKSSTKGHPTRGHL